MVINKIQTVGDVSHYLNNGINQRVAFAFGDDFASSNDIADAWDRHLQFPGKLGLGQADHVIQNPVRVYSG